MNPLESQEDERQRRGEYEETLTDRQEREDKLVTCPHPPIFRATDRDNIEYCKACGHTIGLGKPE